MKKLLLLAPLLAFLLPSCSVNTPVSRIDKNPAMFDRLSNSEKQLVRQGRIRNGMDKQAVYLAWGNPNSTSEGQQGGRVFEKWSYTGVRPVYRQSIYTGIGFGRGYGRYGRYGRGYRRGYYPYSSIGTAVSYLPYRAAWVKFDGGRVQSWQRGRN